MTPAAVPVKLPAVNAVQSVHETGVAHTLVETKKRTVKETKLVVIGLVIFVASSEHIERTMGNIRTVGWSEGPFSDTRASPLPPSHAQRRVARSRPPVNRQIRSLLAPGRARRDTRASAAGCGVIGNSLTSSRRHSNRL